MNICVFCSAYVKDERYAKPARELGTLIAQHGHSLVWGGSYRGTMQIIADSVKAAGGKVYGVSAELFKDVAMKDADEMVIAQGVGERKLMMLEKADAILVLPGGLGSLDELADVLERRKLHQHDKPIIVISIDGFYDGLQQQLERMDSEGFIPSKLDDLIRFVDGPASAISSLDGS